MHADRNGHATLRMSACTAFATLLCLVAVPALAGSAQATLGFRLVIVDSCDITSTMTAEPTVTVACSDPTPYAILRTEPAPPANDSARPEAAARTTRSLHPDGSTHDTAEPVPVATDANLHNNPPATLTVYY